MRFCKVKARKINAHQFSIMFCAQFQEIFQLKSQNFSYLNITFYNIDL